MEEFLVQFKRSGNLHHAYLIPGDTDAVLINMRIFADDLLGIREGNPDYYERIFDSFGVDEAREVKETAYLAPLGERRLFVLGIDSITREAENALLKILEEPPANVHFFLIAPTIELFLPTVRSRVEILRIGATEVADKNREYNVYYFLKATLEKRLEIVKKIADLKDKASAAAFLHELERAIHERSKKSKDDVSGSIEAILLAERYIRDPGSSPKQLLEYVALSLPNFSR
jgi:DNA polymerase III delta prime subunit